MNWSTHPTPIHLLFLKLNMDANLGWIKKKKKITIIGHPWHAQGCHLKLTTKEWNQGNSPALPQADLCLGKRPLSLI